jgi:peptidoglycan/xylan/chitin deacetylase (PgdA/CDA1 family)
VREFEARMLDVRRWFNVLPLSDAINRLNDGSLPARPLCITFDDGYADNHAVALPILRRLGLHATFFVASSFLDGGRMWNDTVIEAIRACHRSTLDLTDLGLESYALGTLEEDRETIQRILRKLKYLEIGRRTTVTAAIAERVDAKLPEDLMMTSRQVAELHGAGMTVGAHTATHPILQKLPSVDAHQEIASGKAALEQIIGSPVKLFAYPNGKPGVDYGREHVEMVRALGFEGAVSTAWGVAQSGADNFQIPRFTPWDRPAWKYAARLTQNLLREPYAVV